LDFMWSHPDDIERVKRARAMEGRLIAEWIDIARREGGEAKTKTKTSGEEEEEEEEEERLIFFSQ
jgi:hypothetical protein